MSNRLSKVAMRTGDDGTTGLGGSSRTARDSLCIVTIGDVDELNSHIGALLTETLPDGVHMALTAIQYDLFDLGDEFRIPGCTAVAAAHVLRLDQWLADYDADLSRLAGFILSGGNCVAAQAYVCHIVTCRTGRSIVALDHAKTIDEAPRQCVNQLSDLLFVLVRVPNRVDGGTDALWKRDEHKPA